MTDINRRQFLKITGATLAGSSLALMGFSPTAALAEVREFKLLRTTETRNTCPYCAVACGIVMYGLGDGSKNAKASIIHIEGDPDHPVNRGTLCPKGAGLLDFVHSPSRLSAAEFEALRARIDEQSLLFKVRVTNGDVRARERALRRPGVQTS